MQGQPTGAFPIQANGMQGQPTGAFGGMQAPQLQLPQQTGMFPGGGGLQPQSTGFNPFSGARPVSSFGPLGAQATGMGMGAFGMSGQQTGAFQQSQPAGAFGAQPTGAFQQQSQPQQQQQQPSFLRPQMTGGAANPFRASQYVPPPMPGQPSLSAGPVLGGGGGMSGMNMGAGGSMGGGGGMNMGGSSVGAGLRPQMTGGGTANSR